MKIVLLIVSVILLLIGSLLGAYIADGMDPKDHADLISAQHSYTELQQKLEELKKTTGGQIPAEIKAAADEATANPVPNPELTTYGGYLGWALLAFSLLTIIITFAKPDLLLIFIGLLVVITIISALIHPEYKFNVYQHTGGKSLPLIAGAFSIVGALAAYWGKRKAAIQIQ